MVDYRLQVVGGEVSTGRDFTAVDLFSGAGGTGWGLKSAGFRVVAALEKDREAADTYKENIGVQPLVIDINDISPADFRRQHTELQPSELDVMVGCPPCQGFSRMRNEKGRTDKKNDLVMVYLQFVLEFHPRFVLFENVPGLIRTAHGKHHYESLVQGLRSAGYAVRKELIDAVNYGVPQHRRRVIVIAGRDGEIPPFPKGTHGPPGTRAVREGYLMSWATVRQAIGQFPPLKAGEEAPNIPQHSARKLGDRVATFIAAVPKNGGGRLDVSEEFWLPCHTAHSGHRDVYGRLRWEQPATVITSGCTNVSRGRFVHPEQDRGLSLREAAALQGFPNEFIFKGKTNSISAQIGNAVPPPLAEALASALKERLRQSEPLHTHIQPAGDIPRSEVLWFYIPAV